LSRRLVTALGLAALALLVAASPLFLASILPTRPAGDAYAYALSVSQVARVAALMLASVAAVLLVVHGWRGARPVHRSLVLVGVVAALGAIVLASPVVRDVVAAHVVETYVETGVLSPIPGIVVAQPPPAARAFALFATESETSGVREVGLDGVPVRRHDVMRVGVVVRGEAWAAEGEPALVPSEGLVCEPSHLEDLRGRAEGGAGEVSYVRWWDCVAERSQEMDVVVTLPEVANGSVALHIAVLPTFTLLGWIRGVSTSVAVVAVVCIASFGGAWLARAAARRTLQGE
jgi:hypothetical protein